MPAFDPTTIRPFSTDKKSLFFPISGALPYKNTELLLHAARWLYENRPNRDYRFAITLRRDELSESQQALWIDDIMEPLGKLPYEDILRWYATAHALVFPSRIETFGLPLVEGMCFGLPILVADVPYAREVCTDYPGAVFLPSTDAVAWGRAIATHLDANAHFLSGVEQVDDWEKLMSLIISHADKEA